MMWRIKPGKPAMTGDNLTALKHLQTDADWFDAAEGMI